MHTKILSVGIYPKTGTSNHVLDEFEGHPFELSLHEDTNILLKPIIPLTQDPVYYVEKEEFKTLKINIMAVKRLLLPKLKKAKEEWDKDFLFEDNYYKDDQK
jgi:hypothetical protein